MIPPGRMKALRLLREGKVTAKLVTPRNAHFEVKGDTGTYSVKCNRNSKAWSCDCKRWVIKGIECSHILACSILLQKILSNDKS